MHTSRCLYVILNTPHERLEDVLMERVAPIVADYREHAALDSMFFVRFSEPTWQLRVRLLGTPEWIDEIVSPRLRAEVASWKDSGVIDDFQFAAYDRELERYGGPDGMALAERLFFIDSLAALDLIETERAGRLEKSRREFSILLVDRLIELAGFDRDQRLAFYRRGYAWAIEEDDWEPSDLALLEQRFQALRSGLDRLLRPDAGNPAERWGGADAARIADHFSTAAAPVIRSIVDGHRAGVIRQDLVYLFWSYAHMFTNRLGIESSAEAILRFFVHRLHEERKEIEV